MTKTLKITISILLCVVSFGLVGFDGGAEIPDTTASGCTGQHIRTPGKTLTVDAQGRIHLSFKSEPENDVLSVTSSQDTGVTWSPLHTFSNPTSFASMASDSSGTAFATYYFTGEGSGLLFTLSDDGGQNWSTPQQIIETVPNVIVPSGEVSLLWGNGNLYLVWGDNRTPMLAQTIYTMSSSNRGDTWSEERAVWDDATTNSALIAANCRGSELAVVWCEQIDLFNPEPDNEKIALLFRSSPDGGQTWGPVRYPAGTDTLMNVDFTYRCPYLEPDVEIGEGVYYVLWDSVKTFFISKSGDGGQNWDRIKVFEDPSDTLAHVEIAERDGLLAALICAQGKTTLKYSTNQGEDWNTPKLLSEGVFPGTWEPNLVIDSQKRIHAQWTQAVNDNTSVLYYYCESTETGIGENPVLTHPVLSAFPNPFSNHVSLHIGLDAEHEIEPVIYDAAGRMVASLGTLSKGQGLAIIDWDGRDERGRRIPRGSYFLRVGKGDEEYSLKIVKVK